MTLRGSQQLPLAWEKRLAFTPPHSFVWKWDPPEGANVGDEAPFKLEDGYYYIRTINGADVRLDKVGALFLGYEPPSDQRVPITRDRRGPVQSKYAVGIKELCEQFGVAPQTYYNRCRSGMPHDFALTATRSEVMGWHRSMKRIESRGGGEVPLEEWQEAAQWMSKQRLDKWMSPVGYEEYEELRQLGLSKKQAILYNAVPRTKGSRVLDKEKMAHNMKVLRRAIPKVQQLLAPGAADPDILLIANLLGVVALMAGVESDKVELPEAVMGNVVMATVRAYKGVTNE